MTANLSVAKIIFTTILALASSLGAAERLPRFITQPDSTVWIDGDCKLHGWQMKSGSINGWLEVGAGFPMSAGVNAQSGDIAARAEVSVPVETLKSDRMTERLAYRLLNANQVTPTIHYRLDKLTPKSPTGTNETGREFDSQGTLAVAGVTNQVTMPLRVTALEGGRMKLVGSLPLKLSAFGIQPPTFKTKSQNGYEFKLSEDEIKVTFQWILARVLEADHKK